MPAKQPTESVQVGYTFPVCSEWSGLTLMHLQTASLGDSNKTCTKLVRLLQRSCIETAHRLVSCPLGIQLSQPMSRRRPCSRAQRQLKHGIVVTGGRAPSNSKFGPHYYRYKSECCSKLGERRHTSLPTVFTPRTKVAELIVRVLVCPRGVGFLPRVV